MWQKKPTQPPLFKECYFEGKVIPVIRVSPRSDPLNFCPIDEYDGIGYHWTETGGERCMGEPACCHHALPLQWRGYIAGVVRVPTGKHIERVVGKNHHGREVRVDEMETRIVPRILEITLGCANDLDAFGSYVGYWFRIERKGRPLRATVLRPADEELPEIFPMQPIVDSLWKCNRPASSEHIIPFDERSKRAQ